MGPRLVFWNAVTLVSLFGARATEGAISPEENLALGKPATQSSTHGGGVASRAVDGGTSTAWLGGSVTHTGHAENNWWEVDLGEEYEIEEVIVAGRSDDCCLDRLAKLATYAGLEAGGTDGVRIGYQAEAPMAGETTFTYAVEQGVRGRYIRVVLEQLSELSLAEVKVKGRPVAVIEESENPDVNADVDADADADADGGEWLNVGLGKPATQSSLYGKDWNASYAVDGDVTTRSHTKLQHGAWWQVDLGGKYEIQSVRVVGRADCCYHWNTGVRTFVGTRPWTGEPEGAPIGEEGSMTSQLDSTYSAEGAVGRYVTVALPSDASHYLVLGEVIVTGRSVDRTLGLPIRVRRQERNWEMTVRKSKVYRSRMKRHCARYVHLRKGAAFWKARLQRTQTKADRSSYQKIVRAKLFEFIKCDRSKARFGWLQARAREQWASYLELKKTLRLWRVEQERAARERAALRERRSAAILLRRQKERRAARIRAEREAALAAAEEETIAA